MDSTLGRASTTENCKENENDAMLLFKPAVLSAIKTIRNKKYRANKESVFDFLTKSLASNTEMELLKHVLATLIQNNIVIDKKAPTGLSSFSIADDSLDRQNEVNSLIGNNQAELNLDFNENSPLPNYNIDTLYSPQVVSRPKKAKDKLNLEARFTALKDHIECAISSLDSVFQFACDKLKTINIPEYETMKTLQNRIGFLQNEVASKYAIIKMLLEMQTGNLDSATNCTSPDKDKITSINITDDSFIPVNNSEHKHNYDQNEKNRMQSKEKTNSENADQELSDINQDGNQTTCTNRDISEKKQLFIVNLHSDTTEEDLYKLFGLRSTQYLKQNCLVNMPLINKTGESKGYAFIVIPEKVHQNLLKLDGKDLLGRQLLIKEAISTRKKDLKQNKRPNFVVNNFPENQDLFKQPRLIPGKKQKVVCNSRQ